MRVSTLAIAAALVMAPLPALAYENFIPLGQNWAPGEDKLPPLGSEQDLVNSQVDVYESEIYNRELRQKQMESRTWQMLNEQEPGNLDENDIDY